MDDLFKSSIQLLVGPIGTMLLSAFVSIITAVITSRIIDKIHIKSRKHDRLAEICRSYTQESISLHKEFRDRIITSNFSGDVNNSINYSSANAFKQKLTDDSELYRLLHYFSIDESGIVNILERPIKRDFASNSRAAYQIVDDIKEEFLKIDKQL
ncbi:MAG: hypothetical protein ABF477_07515 [Leuconostoc pseudomesenteroides]|uniref:hypothetical protein n=1 Tax=Leuconostoc pseudomesenteroides TaxID=33968 RepID=UPI0039EA06AD